MKSAGDTVEETGDKMADVTDDEEKLRDSTKRLARAFARNFSSMASDVDGAEDEVEQLNEALNDIDGKDVNADIDVDGGRGIGSRVGRAAGELNLVDQDMGRGVGEAFDGLSTKAKLATGSLTTLIAATAIAGGAIGAAGGLAYAAFTLASEFENAAGQEVSKGIDELNTGITNLKKQFVSGMAPLLANTVIPGLKELAQEFSKVIPSLTEFAERWMPSVIGMVKEVIQAVPAVLRGLDALAFGLESLWQATKAVGQALKGGALAFVRDLENAWEELKIAMKQAADYLKDLDKRLNPFESAENTFTEEDEKRIRNDNTFVEDGAVGEAQRKMEEYWDNAVDSAQSAADVVQSDRYAAGEGQGSSLFQGGSGETTVPGAPAASASQVQGAGMASGGGVGGMMQQANTRMQQTSQRLQQMKRRMMPLRTMIKSLGNTVKVFGKKAFTAFSQQMGGAIADAIVEGENLLDSFKKIIKGLVKKLIALIAKAVIAASILSLLGVAGVGGISSSFGSNFSSVLGGGGGLGSAATSGATTGASAASAVTQTSGVATSSSTQAMNINITGESRTEGRDIVTSYEVTKADDRRKGRINRS